MPMQISRTFGRVQIMSCLLSVRISASDQSRYGPAGSTLPAVGDPPDRAAGVVGHQEYTILRDRHCRRPASHLGASFARRPEACGKILVIAFRAPILERHEDHLV